MAQYMILMRGSFRAWKNQSPEELQRVMERYHAFVEGLKAQGRFKGGSALKEGSLHFRSELGRILMDGPFVEIKEALNGYFLFEANGPEEASEIALRCPALTHGETVELLELTSH